MHNHEYSKHRGRSDSEDDEEDGKAGGKADQKRQIRSKYAALLAGVVDIDVDKNIDENGDDEEDDIFAEPVRGSHHHMHLCALDGERAAAAQGVKQVERLVATCLK